jgi:hypothetical protein
MPRFLIAILGMGVVLFGSSPILSGPSTNTLLGNRDATESAIISIKRSRREIDPCKRCKTAKCRCTCDGGIWHPHGRGGKGLCE